MKNNLYENDFYLWTQEQVNLLENQSLDKIDIENLIEEIKDLGRNNLRALESQVERLFQHLLKWVMQPERRSRSWKVSIVNSRLEIEKLLENNESLKNKLNESFDKCYIRGKKKAIAETDLIFPDKSPWNFNEINNEDFWPEVF